MKSEEIQEMFRLAADVKRMPPCDPDREKAHARLLHLHRTYMAESLSDGGIPPPQDKPEWQDALEYIAAMFARIDAAENDQNRAAVRALWFALVSDACVKAYGQSVPRRR